jgi:hypothetical protein
MEELHALEGEEEEFDQPTPPSFYVLIPLGLGFGLQQALGFIIPQ